MVKWSWRDLMYHHMYRDGFLGNEWNTEMLWARARPLSMIHCFEQLTEEPNCSRMEPLIKHYGATRVSKAKDCVICQFASEFVLFCQ